MKAGTASYSLISSTTRIETFSYSGLNFLSCFLLTDFQHNKDWNPPSCTLPSKWCRLTHWFPAQQGLKQNYARRLKLVGHNLLTDFQHNKDWNSNGRVLQFVAIILTHWFPAQQGLKQCVRCLWACTAGNLTHWFPAQQGLKLVQSTHLSNGRVLLLTDFQHNKDWNKPCVSKCKTKTSLTHWFPAQQGLKPLHWKTNTKTSGSLLTDFQHNKDWNWMGRKVIRLCTASYSLISSTTRIETTLRR